MYTPKQIKNLFDYDEVDPYFFRGFIRVKKGSQWFHVDFNGKPAYNLKFDHISPFDEKGMARARKDRDWFFIRLKGALLEVD